MATRYVGYLYLFFVAIIGFIFGTVYVQMLPHAQMSDILEHWGSMFSYNNEISSTIEMFILNFLYHLRFFIFMFIFGITIIGYPITLLIFFLKAFILGSTLQLFYFIWENDALAYIVIWLVPSSLLILVGLFILSFSLASYCYESVKMIKQQSWTTPFYKLLKLVGVAFLIVVIATAVQTYLSPYLFNVFITSR